MRTSRAMTVRQRPPPIFRHRGAADAGSRTLCGLLSRLKSSARPAKPGRESSLGCLFPISLLQLGKVIVLPAGDIRDFEELVAVLGDGRTTGLAGGNVGGLLFVRAERKRRIDTHRRSHAPVQRDRPVDGRIKRAAWHIADDDDVAGWLAAE